MNFENFGEVTADESGVHFETGVPVQFRFLHNTESSPYFGAQFQQDIEPGGYYVVHDTMGNGPQVPGWEGGVATADYPLVVVHNTKEEVGYDENSWKARLWEEFGQPSSADRFRDRIRRLGYDAIVTVRLGTQETMEIVLLDPERQIRRGAVAGPPILPPVLFHATPIRNLAEVERHGLRPATMGSPNPGDVIHTNRVFLSRFDDPTYMNLPSDRLEGDLVVLEVDTSVLDIRQLHPDDALYAGWSQEQLTDDETRRILMARGYDAEGLEGEQLDELVIQAEAEIGDVLDGMWYATVSPSFFGGSSSYYSELGEVGYEGAIPPDGIRIRRRWSPAETTVGDAGTNWELVLETLCADDFGAGYRDESERDEEDREHIDNYEETRERHQLLEELAAERGFATQVSDSDDRDSRHSDGYVYFPFSRLQEVVDLLEEIGLPGDVLDVPGNFPDELAKQIQSDLGWTVERTKPNQGEVVNGPPPVEVDPELWLMVHGMSDVESWSGLFAQDPPENVLRYTFAQVLDFPTDDIEDTFGHANNFIDWYYTIVGLYDRHSRGATPKRSITKAFAQWQDELTSRVDEAGIGSFMSTLLAVAGAQALPPKLKKWLHKPDPSQGSAFFVDYSPRGWRDQEYRLVVPYGPGDATSNYTTLLLYAALDAAAFYPKDLGLPSDAPAELHRFIGEGTVPKRQNPRKVGFPEGTKGYVADFTFGELVARMSSYVYGDADA